MTMILLGGTSVPPSYELLTQLDTPLHLRTAEVAAPRLARAVVSCGGMNPPADDLVSFRPGRKLQRGGDVNG